LQIRVSKVDMESELKKAENKVISQFYTTAGELIE